MQPLFAALALRDGWRLLRPGQFLLAAIATILIAGTYAAYRINAAAPDAMRVASQPIDAREHNEPTTMPSAPVAVESKPVEPERTAAAEAPIPPTNPEAPTDASARQPPVPVPATKRASAHQRPVPVPATKRASARQRPAPQRQAPVGATPPVAHSLATARVGARVAETRKSRRPDRWQVMNVSLAHCGGDFIARIVCDQRVRRHFCEGAGMPERRRQ